MSDEFKELEMFSSARPAALWAGERFRYRSGLPAAG
jgi:hypothetical protein